jgi:hypothetical protein
METNNENVYLMANSLLRKLEEPLESAAFYKLAQTLPENWQNYMFAIAETFKRVKEPSKLELYCLYNGHQGPTFEDVAFL